MLLQGPRCLQRFEAILARSARHRILSCFGIAVLALGLRIALLPMIPKPTPEIQDEFSYILAGETLAEGKLANPPHPLWPFFETPHVNMLPTYTSKYPPGQGAFLAVGIRLFGDPWLGVWLSMGLFCGCLCWLLQGWLPPKYALIGSVLATLQMAVTGYWINSYWGGAVAGAGGALVLGAVPRLARRAGTGSAIAAVGGIFILANSRPFEGAVLAASSAAALFWWARRLGKLRALLRIQLFTIALAGLTLTAATLAYYNWRVTGDPVKLPYRVYEQQYHWPPALWFLPTPSSPAKFRDSAMKEMWEWDHYQYLRTRHDPFRAVHLMFEEIYSTFLAGAGSILIFLTAVALLTSSLVRVRVALALLSGSLFLLTSEKLIYAHYLAPVSGLLFLVPMYGLRLLRIASVRGKPIGRLLVATVLCVGCAGFGAVTADQIIKGHNVGGLVAFRLAVIDKLNAEPGRHLVFVRYGLDHYPHEEMVYNGPDIDTQKIVWAIDRGVAENRHLCAYYPDRNVWLMQPDGAGRSLTSYVCKQ